MNTKMIELKKEVTRRDFLKKVGLAIAAVVLATALFRLIFKKDEKENIQSKKTSASSYGGGAYGG